MDAKIVLLPGDGVGPEVVAEARKVLETVAKRFGHRFEFESCLMGGIAIDETGEALPAATLAEMSLSTCLRSNDLPTLRAAKIDSVMSLSPISF